MKRPFAALLTAACLCMPISALADGELTATQQDIYFTESDLWGVTVYCYTKIENTGDVPMEVYQPELWMSDQDGNDISPGNWGDVGARYLQPGEYTYYGFSEALWDVSSLEEIGEYELHIDGAENPSRALLRLSAEPKLEKDVPDKYWPEDQSDLMFAVVTNDLEKPLYDIGIVMALLDQDGHIMDVEYTALPYNFALMPGSSIQYQSNFDQSTDLGKQMKENGIEAFSVDVIGYIEYDVPAEDDGIG